MHVPQELKGALWVLGLGHLCCSCLGRLWVWASRHINTGRGRWARLVLAGHACLCLPQGTCLPRQLLNPSAIQPSALC